MGTLGTWGVSEWLELERGYGRYSASKRGKIQRVICNEQLLYAFI